MSAFSMTLSSTLPLPSKTTRPDAATVAQWYQDQYPPAFQIHFLLKQDPHLATKQVLELMLPDHVFATTTTTAALKEEHKGIDASKSGKQETTTATATATITGLINHSTCSMVKELAVGTRGSSPLTDRLSSFPVFDSKGTAELHTHGPGQNPQQRPKAALLSIALIQRIHFGYYGGIRQVPESSVRYLTARARLQYGYFWIQGQAFWLAQRRMTMSFDTNTSASVNHQPGGQQSENSVVEGQDGSIVSQTSSATITEEAEAIAKKEKEKWHKDEERLLMLEASSYWVRWKRSQEQQNQQRQQEQAERKEQEKVKTREGDEQGVYHAIQYQEPHSNKQSSVNHNHNHTKNQSPSTTTSAAAKQWEHLALHSSVTSRSKLAELAHHNWFDQIRKSSGSKDDAMFLAMEDDSRSFQTHLGILEGLLIDAQTTTDRSYAPPTVIIEAPLGLRISILKRLILERGFLPLPEDERDRQAHYRGGYKGEETYWDGHLEGFPARNPPSLARRRTERQNHRSQGQQQQHEDQPVPKPASIWSFYDLQRIEVLIVFMMFKAPEVLKLLYDNGFELVRSRVVEKIKENEGKGGRQVASAGISMSLLLQCCVPGYHSYLKPALYSSKVTPQEIVSTVQEHLLGVLPPKSGATTSTTTANRNITPRVQLTDQDFAAALSDMPAVLVGSSMRIFTALGMDRTIIQDQLIRAIQVPGGLKAFCAETKLLDELYAAVPIIGQGNLENELAMMEPIFSAQMVLEQRRQQQQRQEQHRQHQHQQQEQQRQQQQESQRSDLQQFFQRTQHIQGSSIPLLPAAPRRSSWFAYASSMPPIALASSTIAPAAASSSTAAASSTVPATTTSGPLHPFASVPSVLTPQPIQTFSRSSSAVTLSESTSPLFAAAPMAMTSSTPSSTSLSNSGMLISPVASPLLGRTVATNPASVSASSAAGPSASAASAIIRSRTADFVRPLSPVTPTTIWDQTMMSSNGSSGIDSNNDSSNSKGPEDGDGFALTRSQQTQHPLSQHYLSHQNYHHHHPLQPNQGGSSQPMSLGNSFSFPLSADYTLTRHQHLESVHPLHDTMDYVSRALKQAFQITLPSCSSSTLNSSCSSLSTSSSSTSSPPSPPPPSIPQQKSTTTRSTSTTIFPNSYQDWSMQEKSSTEAAELGPTGTRTLYTFPANIDFAATSTTTMTVSSWSASNIWPLLDHFPTSGQMMHPTVMRWVVNNADLNSSPERNLAFQIAFDHVFLWSLSEIWKQHRERVDSVIGSVVVQSHGIGTGATAPVASTTTTMSLTAGSETMVSRIKWWQENVGVWGQCACFVESDSSVNNENEYLEEDEDNDSQEVRIWHAHGLNLDEAQDQGEGVWNLADKHLYDYQHPAFDFCNRANHRSGGGRVGDFGENSYRNTCVDRFCVHLDWQLDGLDANGPTADAPQTVLLSADESGSRVSHDLLKAFLEMGAVVQLKHLRWMVLGLSVAQTASCTLPGNVEKQQPFSEKSMANAVDDNSANDGKIDCDDGNVGTVERRGVVQVLEKLQAKIQIAPQAIEMTRTVVQRLKIQDDRQQHLAAKGWRKQLEAVADEVGGVGGVLMQIILATYCQ